MDEIKEIINNAWEMNLNNMKIGLSLVGNILGLLFIIILMNIVSIFGFGNEGWILIKIIVLSLWQVLFLFWGYVFLKGLKHLKKLKNE